MSKTRVMHFINQFFAGIGGEDKADVGVSSLKGAVGPGKALQSLLGDSFEIVVTAYCGDNYFSNHTEEALELIVQIARSESVKMLVAGPAFASGRYGFACAEVCNAVSSSLGLYCVTGMHTENPGVATYQQYKNRMVYAVPTTELVSGMKAGLSKMTQCVSKLTSCLSMGTPAEGGYIPRDFRIDEVEEKKNEGK